MVVIRLNRVGLKKQPTYRITVTDKRNARNGKYLEIIGHYNPRTRPQTEVVKEDRALFWLSVGAQPSDAVAKIFEHTGTMERYGRLRNGTPMEELVAEVEATEVEMPDPRTNYPAPAAGESKIKAKQASLAAQADAAGEAE